MVFRKRRRQRAVYEKTTTVHLEYNVPVQVHRTLLAGQTDEKSTWIETCGFRLSRFVDEHDVILFAFVTTTARPRLGLVRLISIIARHFPWKLLVPTTTFAFSLPVPATIDQQRSIRATFLIPLTIDRQTAVPSSKHK